MGTQHEQQQYGASVTRLRAMLAQLMQVVDDAKAHVVQPLAPGRWEGDEWIDTETEEDRAYIVADELVGKLVAVCLDMCDGAGEQMTPAALVEYVRVMARARENEAPAISPLAWQVLDFTARCEQAAAEPRVGPQPAQWDRIQWMMELPQEEYLAALEARTTDGQPRIVWSIHPDNWDFERGMPKNDSRNNGNGHNAG